MVEYTLPDDTAFAVVLERATGIGDDIFRGIKLVEE